MEQSSWNGQSNTASNALSPNCERYETMCFAFHRPDAMSLATSMGSRGVIIFMQNEYFSDAASLQTVSVYPIWLVEWAAELLGGESLIWSQAHTYAPACQTGVSSVPHLRVVWGERPATGILTRFICLLCVFCVRSVAGTGWFKRRRVDIPQVVLVSVFGVSGGNQSNWEIV